MKIKIKFLKRIIIPGLIFIFLFLPVIALAQGFGDVVNQLKQMAANIVNYIMGVLVYLSAVFANAAGGLLDWVTSPGFISLPYTKAGPLPDGNPIIQTGLNITKNFVNLSLVIVLVFIALAITLRLQEYATQKTLVRLIIIALLVNFAPVICGLIVDASNIIMNYFLVGIREGISGILNDVTTAGLTGTLTRPGTVTVLYLLGKGAIMMVLNLSIGFAFFLFAFIFIFRYVAIWVLVILSPLAFVSWILPATKKLWDMWWKQLLNWCFIGIPLAFFLYLAMHSVAGLNVYFETQMNAPGLERELSDTLNTVFPYFAVLAMLWFGFFIGLSTAAMGSSAVVGFAKTRGGQIWTGAKKGAKWTTRQAGKGIGRWGEEKFKVKERVDWVPKQLEKVPGLRWFVPEKFKKYAEFRPVIEQAQTEAKSYSSRRLMDNVMTGESIGHRATGKILEVISRGDSEDIFEAGRRKFGKNLTDEQLLQHDKFKEIMTRSLQIAMQGGLHNNIIRRDPRLASLMAGQKWAGSYYDMNEEDAIKAAARESRGQHISNWEKQVVSKDNYGLPVTEALMERGRDPFENIARSVKNGVETVQESIDKLFSNYIDDTLTKELPAVAKDAKQGTPRATAKAWSEFREYFKKQHQGKDGFFVALDSQRFKDLGYRKGKYIETEEGEKEGDITLARKVGRIVGGVGARIKGRSAGSTMFSDTGEARKKKRKEPDVGEK